MQHFEPCVLMYRRKSTKQMTSTVSDFLDNFQYLYLSESKGKRIKYVDFII